MTIWTAIAYFILGICAGMIYEREKCRRRQAKWLAKIQQQYILDDDIKADGPTPAEEERREARIRDRELDAARADLLREREEQARDEFGWPD